MKEETSVLEIFQDPLLTLIALIMLGTLWVVVPGGRSEPTDGPSASQIQKEIEKAKEDINSLDQKTKELAAEVQRLIDEIHALEVLEREAKEKDKRAEQKINQLGQEIAKLNTIIQNKKEELNGLEKELEEAREQAEEAKLLEELDQRIRKLKEEIADKEALLKRFEDELKRAKKAQEKSRRRADEQKKLLDKLRHQIGVEREKVRKAEEEKERLEGFLKTRGGIGTYSTELVENKKQVTFEVVNNRLVLINEKNYDVEVFRDIHNSQIIKAVKLTMKGSVMGESINRITEANSEFQTKLTELDPQKHYIFFGVQRDSFEVFLKAREIAWQKGFVIAWHPWEEGPIYVRPGGREVEGRR